MGVAEAAKSGKDATEPATAHCILKAGPGGLGDRFEGSAALIIEAAKCLLDAVDVGGKDMLHPGWGTPVWHLSHLGYFDRMVAQGFKFTILDKPPKKKLFQESHSFNAAHRRR